MAPMEEHQDIYTSKKPEPGKPGTPPVIEVSPAQLHARSLRNTLGLTILMLAVLGGSAWFIYVQEKKTETSPLEQAVLDTTSLMPGRTGETNLPAIASPEPRRPATAPVPLPVPGASESPFQVEPERMAQAMSETRLAKDYLEAHDFDKAETHARKALETWPDMNAALRTLGVLYIQRGQFDQAIAILERALKGNAFNAETYSNLATAYMQKGMLDKAEELLQTALQIAPGYYVAYLNLGLLYLMRGRYEASADYLERGLEQIPNDGPARNNLAVSLIRLGRYDDARKHLHLLINLEPNSASGYFNMAISYTLERKFDEAMNWIREGGRRCSPVACQKYLADSDFNLIRGTPEFQKFMESLYPDLPTPPKS
jgi:tetratricopeptide (TPR) repeat protein